MEITVFTIFPDIIKDFCKKSLLGSSLNKNLWNLNIVNIRDYALDRHSKVDDNPYGGGQGMIIKPDVLGRAIDKNYKKNSKIYYMSPHGKKLNQKKITKIGKNKDIIIICGRYEGIDQRIIEEYKVEEISIGDFVTMGGELPALILIESLARCVDGVINKKSIDEDSFGGNSKNIYNNLLEYPLYTSPRIWKNRKVPEILISGNHKKIEEWKLQQSIEITKKYRPDMYKKFIRQKLINL